MWLKATFVTGGGRGVGGEGERSEDQSLLTECKGGLYKIEYQ